MWRVRPFSSNNEKEKKTFDIVWQDADDVAEVKVHTNDIGDVHENIWPNASPIAHKLTHASSINWTKIEAPPLIAITATSSISLKLTNWTLGHLPDYNSFCIMQFGNQPLRLSEMHFFAIFVFLNSYGFLSLEPNLQVWSVSGECSAGQNSHWELSNWITFLKNRSTLYFTFYSQSLATDNMYFICISLEMFSKMKRGTLFKIHFLLKLKWNKWNFWGQRRMWRASPQYIGLCPAIG